MENLETEIKRVRAKALALSVRVESLEILAARSRGLLLSARILLATMPADPPARVYLYGHPR